MFCALHSLDNVGCMTIIGWRASAEAYISPGHRDLWWVCAAVAGAGPDTCSGAFRAVEDEEDSSDEEGDPPARAPAEPAKYIGPSAGCTAVRPILSACPSLWLPIRLWPATCDAQHALCVLS